MLRRLLIALVMLSPGPVSAEWVALEGSLQSPELKTVYVDPATFRREGNLVTLWQLTDYRWKQGGMVGRRFSSSTTHIQFDCPATRYRLLAFTDYSGHMGTGDPRDGYIEHDTWIPVELGSGNHALWKMACGKG